MRLVCVNKATGAVFPFSEALAQHRTISVEPAERYMHDPIPVSEWFGRWKDETVVCIASGPSLSDEQIEVVRKAHDAGKVKVIAVNNNYQRAPFADVLYARDLQWWDGYKPEFAGEKWTACEKAWLKHGCNYVRQIKGVGLCMAKGAIHSGRNSGYQAINLAAQMGSARILLIGYDMHSDGEHIHWFGVHSVDDGLTNPTVQQMREWRAHMGALAQHAAEEGIEIINCTADTALRCFDRGDIAAILEDL